MTVNEVMAVIEDLRKEGYNDQMIAASFVNLFISNRITIEQCDGMLQVLGFHIPEEVLALPHKEQIKIAKKMIKS